MTTRGIRRKKSTLTELKIAVIGSPGVGKSGKKIDGGVMPAYPSQGYPPLGPPRGLTLAQIQQQQIS